MPKSRKGLKRRRGVSQAEEARRLAQRSSQVAMRQVSEPKPAGEISTENPTSKTTMTSDAFVGMLEALFAKGSGPVYAENFLLGLAKKPVIKGNKITMRWVDDAINVYKPHWGELPLDAEMKTAWEGWT